MGSTRRAFTVEYKTNAVALVIDSGRTIADVARSINVSEQTLGKWVNKHKESQPEPPPTASERAELDRLRKENADLRMENDFLKKAAAWFAKHVQ